MAKRKFLVVAGQSNASPIGDSPTWEDEHPTIALRSPLITPARAPQFSEAPAYAELLTMPATFAGGPQTGWLGDGPAAGKWQTVDLHGKVVPAVRFLTFYNPTPSYLNLGTGETTTYPGQGKILSATSGNVITTSVFWQYDPVGLVLTRLRTGTTHTIAAGWVGPSATITVTPPMVPPPEANEVFSYTPTGGAGSSTTEVKLVQRFGGLNDLGSLFDAPPVGAPDLAATHYAEVRRIPKGLGGFAPAVGTCLTRFPFVGQPITFNPPTTVMLIAATNTTSETITLTVFSGTVPPVGSLVVFTEAGGTVPGGITAGVTYFVVYSVGNDIRVSTTEGGSPVNLTSVHTGTVTVGFALPSTITPGATYYVTRVGKEDELQFVTAFASNVVQVGIVLQHELVENERIRFSGSPLPPEITAGTDYYVKVTAPAQFSISVTRGGAVLPFTDTGAGALITRQEGSFHFNFSASPGGTEVVLTNLTGDGVEVGTRLRFSEQFRGSLTGMTLRAITGPNAGQTVPLGDIYYDIAGVSVVRLGSPFLSAPTLGDTYAIEPPKVNGKDVPFHKWAYFLPWCPFEGRARYHGPYSVGATLAEANGVELFISIPDAWPQEQFRLAGRSTLTAKLNYGKRYYTETANTAETFISYTYIGTPIVGTTSVPSPASATAILLRQEGKTNPYPPGFNYPNHNGLVNQYQPFEGPGLTTSPRIGFAPGLGVSLAEYYGEPVYVVQLAVGGTNIGHTDVLPAAYGPGAYNWFDVRQLLSWSPTDINSIFARFLDTLDAAKLAFEAVGDEGECIGIVWVQGEGDASFEELANRYEVNARRLKTAMRQAIKDRGMFSRPIEELRWIDPHCQTTPEAWPYATAVNTAKDALIAEDPYSATFEQQDLQRLNELKGPTDSVHYSGAGMTELERRAYAAFLSIGEGSTDVEISNLALSLIGEPAKVFSLDTTVDQSAQAAECAKFLPIARDSVLESYSWSFATKLVDLVPATKDAVRTDWTYAYLLPPDLMAPLEVLLPGTVADAAASTELTPLWRSPSANNQLAKNGHPYVVEKDARGRSVLFTNIAEARLRYNQRVTAATVVPTKFKLAVARKLASLLAGQFAGGEKGAGMGQRLDMIARGEAGDAAATDANRQQNRPHWPTGGAWGRE